MCLRHQRRGGGGTNHRPTLNLRADPMRTKAVYFVLTVIVALAALFAARQRTLHALRAGNDSLRSQFDLAKPARGAAVPDPPTNSVARLSDADEKELLQLRSKILPLREQLRDASNRVAVLQRPRNDAGSSSQRAVSETMTDFMKSETYLNATKLAKALSHYLRDSGGQLPDPGNLAAAVQLYADVPAAFSQRFELIRNDTAQGKPPDESLIPGKNNRSLGRTAGGYESISPPMGTRILLGHFRKRTGPTGKANMQNPSTRCQKIEIALAEPWQRH